MKINVSIPSTTTYRLQDLQGDRSKAGVYRPVNDVTTNSLIFISSHDNDRPFYLPENGPGWNINWTADFNNGGPRRDTDNLLYKVEIETIIGKVVK